jgi:hypothetical protein
VCCYRQEIQRPLHTTSQTLRIHVLHAQNVSG